MWEPHLRAHVFLEKICSNDYSDARKVVFLIAVALSPLFLCTILVCSFLMFFSHWLARLYYQSKAAPTPPKKRGRHSLMETADIKAVNEDLLLESMKGNCPTKAQLTEILRQKMRESLQRRGQTWEHVSQISATTIGSYMGKLQSYKVRKAQLQNKHRYEVFLDSLGFFALSRKKIFWRSLKKRWQVIPVPQSRVLPSGAP